MTYKSECVDTDVLETRTGIRVLANNEVSAVAGRSSVWNANYFYNDFTALGASLDWYISPIDGKMHPKGHDYK